MYLHHHVGFQSSKCKFVVEQPCNHLQTYTQREISVKMTMNQIVSIQLINVRPDLLFSLKRQERTMNRPLSTICVAGLTTGTSISSSLPCIDTFSSFSRTAARCFCKRQIPYLQQSKCLLKSKVNKDTRLSAHCFKSSFKIPIKSEGKGQRRAKGKGATLSIFNNAFNISGSHRKEGST